MELQAHGDDATVMNAKARLEAARKVYEAILARYQVDINAKPDPEKLYQWSRRWMLAQRDLASKNEEQIAAAEGHLSRMKTMRALFEKIKNLDSASALDSFSLSFFQFKAEQAVAEAKGNRRP
jgi:hypothetical protein